MKFVTIMLIVLHNGQQYGLVYLSAEDCGDALHLVPSVEETMNVQIDRATCIETTAPSVSIRPQRNPWR